MENKFVIEFWYEEEVIDWKESTLSLIIPRVGEKIAIMTWENPSNSDGHIWWVVKEVKHAIWKDEAKTILTQKIMIEVEPESH